jgi:hypothetical protein
MLEAWKASRNNLLPIIASKLGASKLLPDSVSVVSFAKAFGIDYSFELEDTQAFGPYSDGSICFTIGGICCNMRLSKKRRRAHD